MKGIEQVRHYTILEMSIMLGVSVKTVRNKLGNLKLKKSKSVNRIGLYTNQDVEALRSDKRLLDLKHEKKYEQLVYERSQTPVVITYYIYESKLNQE